MIYHVATAQEWSEQSKADSFAPAAFAQEGFIHCCTQAQLAGVLERYYKGQTYLLLLAIDDKALTFSVTYEKQQTMNCFRTSTERSTRTRLQP